MTLVRRIASWNMKEGRPGRGHKVLDTAADEVEELADGLDWLFLHEAGRYSDVVAKRLRRAGKRVLRVRGGYSARDTMIVVERGVRVRWPRLIRLCWRGWERRPGRKGLHPGRSAMTAVLDGVGTVDVHMPPTPGLKAYPKRDRAWWASLRRLERLARRWNENDRDWLMDGDWNRRADDPVMVAFAERLGATIYAAHPGDIDYVIARGVHIGDVRRVRHGSSDHDPNTSTLTKEK